MKGLAELTAENDALVRCAQEREDAKYRRLKQRIARVSWRFGCAGDLTAAQARKRINAAIDAWRKAEAKRGGR